MNACVSAQGEPKGLERVSPNVWRLRTPHPFQVELSLNSESGYKGVYRHSRKGSGKFTYEFGASIGPTGRKEPYLNKWGRLFDSAAEAAYHRTEHKNLVFNEHHNVSGQ